MNEKKTAGYERQAAIRQLQGNLDQTLAAAKKHFKEHGAREVVEKTISQKGDTKIERTEKWSWLDLQEETRAMEKRLAELSAGADDGETEGRFLPTWLIARALDSGAGSDTNHCPAKSDSTDTSKADSKDSQDQ